MYRSTKGASKARRDQINAEIRSLKDLLPISDADKARLSYLHIMSLACMYTRKSVFFAQDASVAARHEVSGSFISFPELAELAHALPGFLLLLSSEGKLLYVSDNVAEHLGHSMVDLVAQSDSVYDIVDPGDHFIMRSNLVPMTTPDTDRLFRCRFNTSKFIRRQGAGNKLALVRARCLSPPYPAASYWTSNPVWVCFCSPLEPQAPCAAAANNPLPTPPADHTFFLACFHSQHSRDMRLQDAEDSVNVYLGYEVETLRSRSWYSLLHPRDLAHASAQHCTLLHEGGKRQVEMVVQLEAVDHSWVWLYMVLQLKTGEYPISCQNYIISESEAWSVRQQLYSEQNQLALFLSAGGSYQEGLGLPSSDALSSPDQVFTPSSSGLSAQSFDFSFSASGRSSSEELGSAAAPSMLPAGGDPRNSLSLDDESFTQLHASRQQWPAEAGDLSATPAAAASPTRPTAPLPASGMMCVPALPSALQPPVLPLPPLTIPHPQRAGEFVCTPPYSPRLGGGSFMFGEELFNLDATNIGSSGTGQVAQATTLPASINYSLSLSAHNVGLILPTDPCRRPLYEKLPPSPDSPGSGECTIMALPEIRGPLYVDVPHGPPEGLLTPEASPTKQLCPAFFAQGGEKERERLEISLLAQYISSLAEGFYHDPLLPKPSPPDLPSALTSYPSAQNSDPPLSGFYPAMPCRGPDSSPEDISMFAESVLVDAPLQVPSSSSSSPFPPSPCSSLSSNSSPQYSPPTPVSWFPPSYTQGGESPVGVHHFCSVQSTQCNRMTGAGVLWSGPAEEGEALPESVVDMELSLSSTIPASPEPAATLAASAATPGLLCAQSLLEELVAMEPVFGAGALISPPLRQQPELYQLPHHNPAQSFYQDGTSDHTF